MEEEEEDETAALADVVEVKGHLLSEVTGFFSSLTLNKTQVD